MAELTISATGCTLVDYLYGPVDFAREAFRKYQSIRPGDGGLVPGQLVFLSELEQFTSESIDTIISEITGGRPPTAENLGGPSIVSVIHAAQLLGRQAKFQFIAATGKDRAGEMIREFISRTPLKGTNLIERPERTPFTYVLSDPGYDGGNGERTFINNIGAAGELTVSDLPPGFFSSDILALGGTALVPGLHDGMDEILRRTSKHTFRIVNTVFDFRNEHKNPGKPWPLGRGHDAFRYIDLLIMDRDEALKISGTASKEDAIACFEQSELGSFIITDGTRPVVLVTQEGRSRRTRIHYRLPVSKAITEMLGKKSVGDTTGAGDNFAGGVIYSIARQMLSGKSRPDLEEACAWGIVSGGFACSYIGGTYLESKAGEKLKKIEHFYQEYRNQGT